jgi:saccharopine dehydrogenase-like NADP-dependent oxidoreductase
MQGQNSREALMKDVFVIGAGRIGRVVAEDLAAAGDYQVTLAHRRVTDAEGTLGIGNLSIRALDVTDSAALDALLAGKFAVLSTVPFHLTAQVAEGAARVGVHYLDLTEDVASTRRIKEVARGARTAFVPQCGLAPGFVSIVANDLVNRFDTVDTVRMRVGALPQFSSNALNYNLTWSPEGLINEYCEFCDAIIDGERRQTPALEEREEFTLDGVRYEAFNTSGGLGTLAETLLGRVRTLNYRSIRYPGHRDIMKLLLHDLRLRERREMLRDILEAALPMTLRDLVVIYVVVDGTKHGVFLQESYTHKVYAREIGGIHRTAIQMTTAAGMCAVLDLLAAGQLPQHGFVRQEDIALDAFLSNRFGSVFEPGHSEPIQV